MKDVRLAVDLGTTTIDMCLVDELGQIISQRNIKNRQSLYGSDVINRILTTVRDAKYIQIMKEIVVEDIVSNLMSMLYDSGFSDEAIKYVVICGNTTMISILLEYDMSTMGQSPFETKLKQSVCAEFKDIFGEKLNINCPVILSGCVSAFIGGDIISGMLYLSKEYNSFGVNDNSLLIDLGTNGEMVFNNHGKLLATSAACGPAFEGSLKKKGIYGSTLIDAISLGIKSGNISREGILSDKYIDNGINISNILIDSELLRDIMSAKAAIRTGIDFLIRESKIDYHEIDNVYVAGGFGKYLNINNAIDIGLLPSCLSDKIKVVGNTSLFGAIMLLRDNTLINEFDTYTKDKVLVLQLANEAGYQNCIIDNMCFKRM